LSIDHPKIFIEKICILNNVTRRTNKLEAIPDHTTQMRAQRNTMLFGALQQGALLSKDEQVLIKCL
jgi:hypothetical protein